MSVYVSFSLKAQANTFPAGTILKGYQVSIGDVAPAQFGTVGSAVEFKNIPEGTYTATVQAVDDKSNPLGAPSVSEPFTIAHTDSVSIFLPDVVSVIVQ